MSDEIQDFSVGSIRLSQWVAGLVLVLVLGWVGWGHFQKSSLVNALSAVEVQTSTLTKQLNEMQEAKLDAVIVAKAVADQVHSNAIQWSKVVRSLLEITPLDVFYSSYSASVEGKMNLNAITDTYESAAQLISVLDKNSTFSDVFVPSLTQGATEGGASAVSFGVTFNVQ